MRTHTHWKAHTHTQPQQTMKRRQAGKQQFDWWQHQRWKSASWPGYPWARRWGPMGLRGPGKDGQMGPIWRKNIWAQSQGRLNGPNYIFFYIYIYIFIQMSKVSSYRTLRRENVVLWKQMSSYPSVRGDNHQHNKNIRKHSCVRISTESTFSKFSTCSHLELPSHKCTWIL